MLRRSRGGRARQHRRPDQLRELMEACVAIMATPSLPEMLQAIADRAAQLIGAEQAAVAVGDESRGPLHAFYLADQVGGFDLRRAIPELEELADGAATPLRLDRHKLKSRGHNTAGLRGWLAVPLLAPDGGVLGTVQLANKAQGQFTEDDEYLLAQMAQFASVAIENTRLYLEARTQLAERARAEQAMHLYQQIFAACNDAIAIVDPSGFYLEQNAAHRRLTGYSDEDLHGQTPAIHLGEETFAHLAKLLQANGQFRGEVTSRTRAGEKLSVDLSAFAMRDSDGKPLCYVGIKRDISDRHRIEEEIRARVVRQAAVVELGRQALASTELDLLMRTAAEIVAKTLDNEFAAVLELVSREGALVLRAAFGWSPEDIGKARLSTNSDSQSVFTLRSRAPVIIDQAGDEKRFGVSLLQERGIVSGMSVPIEGRETTFGVINTHSTRQKRFTEDDVSFLSAVANVLAAAVERKCVEQELHARVRQQAAVAGLGRRALRGTDLGQLMDEATRLVAQTLEVDLCKVLELLPGNRELLLRAGVGWKEGYVGHKKISAGLGSHSGFTLVSSGPVIIADLRTENRFMEPLLQEHGVLSGVSAIIDAGGGRAFGVLGAYSRAARSFTQDDINFLQGMANMLAIAVQRGRADAALHQSEKLAAVGRLAATIAHEINNPLESVTNLLYLLENHVGLDDAARSYASLAQQELHRVAHIARQTLSFHRETATAVPVNLSELLDNVLRMHARRIAANSVEVKKRYEFHEPVKVLPAEMQQVISNLVLNALEALGTGGKLLVRLTRDREWQRPYRRGVRLVVADNGPGIPPDSRQQIFEPFFTTKGEKGTGLGLWITNGIVQKHKGHIRVRSSVAPGRSYTCFSIFLPVEEAHAEAGKEQSTPPSRADKNLEPASKPTKVAA